MSESDFQQRARKAAGPERNVYLDGTDVDRVMAVVLALASELASVRERLDTHERLAASGHAPTVSAVESYWAEPSEEAKREAWREAYIRRIFRVIGDDIERLRGDALTNG